MVKKKFLLPALATLLFFNGYLTADEITQENTEASIEGHIPVRSREMDPEKREQMQRSRTTQNDEEINDQAETKLPIKNASHQISSSKNEFMFAPREMTKPEFTLAAYGAYAFPINCHWLTSIADSSRSFELEDGSHWEVSPSDTYILRNWRREDSLIITPNSSWLSQYDYYVTNKSNNTYVKANLFVGPMAYGPYSHWIVDIDYFGGHVYLENQMVWCVSPQDNYLLKDWAVNDHIIFGLYDSWFSPFDHILINVNMDNHVHVKQY